MGLSAGTARLKKHISITMEFASKLTSLVMQGCHFQVGNGMELEAARKPLESPLRTGALVVFPEPSW